MPRTLPWTNHQNATGERPLFFARVEFNHQTVDLGLYDWLPGTIQGRVPKWDELYYQLRGGQDSIRLRLSNAPSAALGKALRCKGATPNLLDGSYAYIDISSGTAFRFAGGDVSGSFLFRPWDVRKALATGSIIAIKSKALRFLLFPSGNVMVQGWDEFATLSWLDLFEDVAACADGQLCAIAFSFSSSQFTLDYFRRSDAGDGQSTIDLAAGGIEAFADGGTEPWIFNGDGGGTVSGGESEGRYCPWLDVDEFRGWNTARASSDLFAMARRTMKPSEKAVAGLEAWLRWDTGTGGNEAKTAGSASVAGKLGFDNSGGTLSPAANPSWISGLCRDRISDQIEASYPLEGATVKVFVTFTDPISKTPYELFRGKVREVVSVDRMSVVLDVVDVSESAHKLIGTLIEKTSFPNAPTESIGKVQPIVFGTVPGMVGIRTVAAQKTALRTSILSSDTTIPVEDTSAFPSTGQIRIDEEVINYTGKTSNTFTGATRGYASTLATSHVTGAEVAQETNENYLFAEHAVTDITNIRKRNSRGELIPAAASEYTKVLTGPSGLVWTGVPRVSVLGKGSLWTSIDMLTASGFNTATNPLRAARLSAEWTETNYATIDAAHPKLSIERNTDYPGPTIAAGVLKAYAVFEHHRVNTLAGAAVVACSLEVGGVPVVALGNLTVTTNTPAQALQTGQYHTESAGFESAHSHTIPGGTHEHGVGQDVVSVVVRAVGGEQGFCYDAGRLALSVAGVPQTGVAAWTYTATQFFSLGTLDPASDDNPDTFLNLFASSQNIPLLRKWTFANLRGTNRQIKRARLVAIVAGSGQQAAGLGFYVRGTLVTSIGPIGNIGAGLQNRTTVTSAVVDVTSSNLLLADLMRPDSAIAFGANLAGVALQVYEVYVELELDNTAENSTVVRPTYDNWRKPLPNLRDGRWDTFEPKGYTSIVSYYTGGGPFGPPLAWAPLFLNPNPPIVGPDLPFNTQVQPNIRFYFTDIEEPYAALRSAAVFIAHTNIHHKGAHVAALPPGSTGGFPTLFGPIITHSTGSGYTPAPGGLLNALGAQTWSFVSAQAVEPRYLVRLVIRGVIQSAFNFSLDMTDASPPVYYHAPAAPGGQLTGVWSRPGALSPGPLPFFGGTLGLGLNALITGRVESTSGWRSLVGAAPGGGDFLLQDLVAANSYVEILLPPPGLDAVDVISPGGLADPNWSTQVSVWNSAGADCAPICALKLFDVRLEYVSGDVQPQALPADVGATTAVEPLAHSSLTWFDVSAVWFIVNSWNAMLGVEMVAVATSFGAQDYVRILRANVTVEFGFVEQETTTTIVADVNQGGGGNPIDHVERVFDSYIGSTYKNTAAFTTAKALARTDAAGVVLEQINTRDLIDKILLQYNFSGHWDVGQFIPLFMPDLGTLAAGSPTFTVDKIARGSVKVRRTPPDEIRNKVEIVYGPDYLNGGFTDRKVANNTPSQTAYGFTRSETIEADWVVTAAAAQALADRRVQYRSHVQAIVEFVAYLDALSVARGDVVQVSHEFRTTTKLEVLEMGISPGGGDEAPTCRIVGVDRTDRPT